MARLKSVLFSAVRPLARPVWRAIWPRIEPRVSAATRAAALEAAWDRHVPALLNAVSSVGAFGKELQRMRQAQADVLVRVDAETASVRQDLKALEDSLRAVCAESASRAAAETQRLRDQLESIRFGLLQGRGPEHQPTAAPLASSSLGGVSASPGSAALPEHVAAMLARGEPIRLNLGCGPATSPGYVNVAPRHKPGVDIVADGIDLPFAPGSVAEIVATRLLEHYPQEVLRHSLLPYWTRLLQPDGTFRAVVQDGAAMAAGVAAGTWSFDAFRKSIYGSQHGDGDFHYNLFTPDSLTGLLREAGFQAVEVLVTARPNGGCLEFEIVARRS